MDSCINRYAYPRLLLYFLLLKFLLHNQRLYEEERQANKQARTSFMKLLNEFQVLQQRFEECSINLVYENEDDLVMDHSSCSDALNLLTTCDNQINFLLAEVFYISRQFPLSIEIVCTMTFEFQFCDSCIGSGKWHVKLGAFQFFLIRRFFYLVGK